MFIIVRSLQRLYNSAVDPVGALCAVLSCALHHAKDGDALLFPGVVSRGHSLRVQQLPVRPRVQQQSHQRNVPKSVTERTEKGRKFSFRHGDNRTICRNCIAKLHYSTKSKKCLETYKRAIRSKPEGGQLNSLD
jgi:hypothetical protein